MTPLIDQLITDFNIIHFAVICLALSLGALVKGISSFGLPTVSVPILIMVLPLPTAISVLAVPLVLSNLYQMLIAGDVKGSVARHWSLYLTVLVTLPIGVYFLAVADTNTLSIILGIVLILVTSMELLGLTFDFVKTKQAFIAPVIGVFSGIIGGMTSLFAIMPIFFLVAVGLEKERFVSAVSVLLFSGSTLLAICLQRTDHLGLLEAVYGLLGMVPIMFFIWLGTQLRKKVDQELFRKVVLSLILLIGASMIYRATIGF
ncbi:sulfite exporter TauE/SafE family protein [Sneathiella glossodoripedis]|uniref:sulfite exporter TauE/SafE family protein n=1 Tax=Sneathiella glossodoripedis TaxID=418853 RepID=UPI0009FC2825|nr:sulfite exporter TauE/SafE family protein [Sneathiella glossodoripedis]